MKTYIWANQSNLTDKIAAQGIDYVSAFKEVVTLIDWRYELFSIEKKLCKDVILVQYQRPLKRSV